MSPRCRSQAASPSTLTPPEDYEAVARVSPPRSRAKRPTRSAGSSPTSRRWPAASATSTTSPTRASRRRCSWALRLPQPLLLEGEAGVGKTEAAKSLAAVLDTPLIRLQCYEGIDAAEALYEWNYPRQLLSIRLADAGGAELARRTSSAPTTSSAARCCGRSSTRARARRCC